MSAKLLALLALPMLISGVQGRLHRRVQITDANGNPIGVDVIPVDSSTTYTTRPSVQTQAYLRAPDSWMSIGSDNPDDAARGSWGGFGDVDQNWKLAFEAGHLAETFTVELYKPKGIWATDGEHEATETLSCTVQATGILAAHPLITLHATAPYLVASPVDAVTAMGCVPTSKA